MENHSDVDVSDLVVKSGIKAKRFESLHQPVLPPKDDNKKVVPEWFVKHLERLGTDEDKIHQELSENTRLDMDGLTKKFGGSIKEVPFEILTQVIRRSDNPQVELELKLMRNRYYRMHPEEDPTRKNKYYITYDGRVILDEGQELTQAQKREITVGTTCFHYNSDTPGMSDTD